MPEFLPFKGTRYSKQIALEDVIAPPYDVVDENDRKELASRHVANAIHVELPEAGGNFEEKDRYLHAAELLDAWVKENYLEVDEVPSFYGYKMTFKDEYGQIQATFGFMGALKVDEPGTGDILPHEKTLPKAKTDRLDLIRATKYNLSPIWGLSLTAGLSKAISLPNTPDMTAVDDENVTHELWVIREPKDIKVISDLVAQNPILIADGHHRYETAWNYRNEIRRENGNQDGGHDYVLAFIVELSPMELHVRAIHRLIKGAGANFDFQTAWSKYYSFEPFNGNYLELGKIIESHQCQALITKNQAWLITPTQKLIDEADSQLDSARLSYLLGLNPDFEVQYQHGLEKAVESLSQPDIDAVVILNPVTIDQIQGSSEARFRMPPKSTFFTPKPRTGMVFRNLTA